MIRHTTIALAFFLALGAASRAEAQYTTTPYATPTGQACPPGQPCVVVVPQPQPQQLVAAYSPAPQRQAVEVRRSRLRWGLIGPGIGMLVSGWIGNWLLAIGGSNSVSIRSGSVEAGNYYGWSWVPLIGPFVNAGYFSQDRDPGYLTFHLLFGILQAGGLLLCILGTVLREEVVQVRYVLGDDPEGPTLSVLPYADQGGGGLMATIAGF